MGPRWVDLLDHIYLLLRTHRTSGDFNPGVQLCGTPITAQVVHGGIMKINVMWIDAQGCVIVGSWSKSSGWDLANPNSGKALLDGQDWGLILWARLYPLYFYILLLSACAFLMLLYEFPNSHLRVFYLPHVFVSGSLPLCLLFHTQFFYRVADGGVVYFYFHKSDVSWHAVLVWTRWVILRFCTYIN